MFTIPLDSLQRTDSGSGSYLEPSASELAIINERLHQTVKQIRKCKRIVVVCGAGVSTAASIPDFRSADGLFRVGTQKRRHGVKDLFHIDALLSDTLLPEHHALINDLYTMTDSALPTPFHDFLKSLDEQGRLLRCYTQNIDGLEIKAGLEVGLPRAKKRPSQEPSPMKMTPRCIPLHGLLTHLTCTRCSISYPFQDQYPLPSHHVPCPSCHLSSSIRQALSERQRGVGLLRASIVLYGEDHPRGEDIGWIVERDLRGSGRGLEREGKIDLLLVAGTSLMIPGVKRMVKEMARSLRPSKREQGDKRIRTVFLNAEPPPKTAEWDSVFDIWIKSDIQSFITGYINNPSFGVAPPRTPRKQKRQDVDHYPTPPSSNATPRPVYNKDSSDFSTPTPVKRRRIDEPSPSTPMSRVEFEGSLTPLSDTEDEDVQGRSIHDVNPFLV